MATVQEALEILKDGHTIWSVDFAKEVCAVLGVAFDKDLVQVYESDRHTMGITMLHGPEQGVYSLHLSQHVADKLGVSDKARGFIGRGSQAREYAKVVAEKLSS